MPDTTPARARARGDTTQRRAHQTPCDTPHITTVEQQQPARIPSDPALQPALPGGLRITNQWRGRAGGWAPGQRGKIPSAWPWSATLSLRASASVAAAGGRAHEAAGPTRAHCRPTKASQFRVWRRRLGGGTLCVSCVGRRGEAAPLTRCRAPPRVAFGRPHSPSPGGGVRMPAW